MGGKFVIAVYFCVCSYSWSGGFFLAGFQVGQVQVELVIVKKELHIGM